MYYKIHPPFHESLEQEMEHNQTLAYLAQLDTLLLEFEHSEEFRACSQHYLNTPRIILEDFIHESSLGPEHFDSEALGQGLFVVLPSRVVNLLPEDAHQIMREQISFWAFASHHWQFEHAPECVGYLSAHTLHKLHNIIGLGHNSQRKSPKDHHWQSEYRHEEEIYPLTPLRAL